MTRRQRPLRPRGLTRRSMIVGAAATAGGLAIGLPALAASEGVAAAADGSSGSSPTVFDLWLRIEPGGDVVIQVANSEMGQGVVTALPQILAEELDADWETVRTEFAPTAKVYYMPGDILPFSRQMTGIALTVSNRYDQMRVAGATARAMLVAAAAARWNVEAGTCTAEKGYVIHPPTSRRLGYGELASDAARMLPPDQPPLKNPKEFALVGHSVASLDAPLKASGRAVYGIDIKLDGLLIATVRRSPVFGGAVSHVDGTEALAMPGVKAVVPVPGGVAAVAERYWQAEAALNAVEVAFDDGPGPKFSSESIEAEARAGLEKPGQVMTEVGSWEKASANRPVMTSDYYIPLMTHVCMEPPNCAVHLRADYCEVWVGAQENTLFQRKVGELTGFSEDQIVMHTPFLGGGFGRRDEAGAELVQAVEIAKELRARGIFNPVKLIWSRTEDIQQGYYRLPAAVRVAATLAEDGYPDAFFARVASPSLIEVFFPELKLTEGDPTSVYALTDEFHYAVPNRRVELNTLALSPIPTGPFRGVGYAANVFALEGFIDELAGAARKDALAYRMHLLRDNPRAGKVLETAADASNWGREPEGRACGIAVHQIDGALVAAVVELGLDDDRTIRAHHVSIAIDCGRAVNPRGVRAQLEGGAIQSLSTALHEMINMQDGRVTEVQIGSSAQRYRLLTLKEAPEVTARIVPSDAHPIGVGEAGIPVTGAAAANALSRLTGRRARTFPLKASATG